MENIKGKLNKSMLSLAILAALVAGVPSLAFAERAGYVTPYNSTRMRSVSTNEDEYNTYTGSSSSYSGDSATYNSYSGTRTVYSSSSAPRVITTSSGTSTSTRTNDTTTVPAGGETLGEETSNAAAAAIVGSQGSWLPSGLIQWLFFAILILVIVIIVRKIMGYEDHYHSEPMKHA